MIIVGAGLAGLIAATQWPDAQVVEAGSEPQHKALLRFRSPDVGNATGIEFRKVRVNKGIWYDGSYRKPSIQLANWYALKVIGRLASRSIWDIDPCDRYVAPTAFIGRLIEKCGNRIDWNSPVDAAFLEESRQRGMPVISTMPLPVLASMLDHPGMPEFSYAPIQVERHIIPGADVFQTIYFPDPSLALYRASITGDLLIIESMAGPTAPKNNSTKSVWKAFGLEEISGASILEKSARQTYGKIAPIDDAWRRRFIFETTLGNGIWSLGRFATWRNILLDDVLDDIHVIKRLLSVDHYAQMKIR